MAIKLLLLVALTGASVLAEVLPTYPEDLRANQGRIVSGWEANNAQFPYQLSLRNINPTGQVSGCGATIIHNEWALTAAHCTSLRVTILIRVGATELSYPELVLETTEYYNHPSYVDGLPFVQQNDIGVIKFPFAIEYTDRIQPIRLQSSTDRNSNYDRMVLTATGWGRTWTNGPSPQRMNWVYLLGVTNFNCLIAYNFSPIIVDSTICAAGYNVTSQSTCQGDSGGGLTVVDIDGIATQVGVSSFVSSGGCHTEVPAGFIRPGHYHDWYTEVTGIDFDWYPATTVRTTTNEVTTTESESVVTASPEISSSSESEEDSDSTSEED